MKPKGLAKTLLGASGLTAAIVVNFASLTANAANLSWDADAIFNNGTLGGTGTWNTALANWDNGATDTTWATNTIAGDTAIFAGTAGTVTLGTNINALGLTFNTTGYTLGLNGNTLALGTGGINASALSSGTTTISGTGDVNLAAAQAWNVGTGATLNVSSVVSGANLLTKSGAGTLILSGANTNTGSLVVAGGTLTLSNTLGTNTANGNFKVGTVAGTKATLNITSGANITNRFNLFVGDAGAGTGGGAVYQSGGTLTLTQGAGIDNLRIGSNAGGYGYYKLSGGSLTTNEAGIGASLANTTGVMDVTAGTFTDNGWITVGRGSGTSSGMLNVTGGTVTATRLEMNWGGTAGATSIFNVGGGSGTASVSTAGSTTLGLNLVNTSNVAGVIGVANLLTNGTLTTGIVTASQANPTALLNFNGGTLKAATTNAGANFLTSANIDAVTVYSGGGTIDNSGTSITVGKVLAGATGNGVTSIAVTNGGSGYIGAPLVTITGGTGNTATGYAVMVDDGTGNGTYKVGSIVITSPGTYTVDPTTVTLTGGGATTAASGFTVSTAANTSGGMTFSGGGITTLSAANTYNGTFVNTTLFTTGAGTLGIGNVTVANSLSGTLTLGNSTSIADTATLFFGANSFITLSDGINETVFGVTQTDDSQSIGAGTYTAAQLNTFFGVTDVFNEATTGTLTVVPEPSAALLGGLGILGLLRRRRTA